MTTANIIAMPSRLEVMLAECAQTKEALESAWKLHYDAVMALKDSKLWQAKAKTWQEFLQLEENKGIFFADSTYRQTRSNLPVHELASVVGVTLSREQMNNIGRKLAETMPAERTPMRLSVLALCYAYHAEYGLDKPVPDKNVIQEAYEVLAEERRQGTITTKEGETFVLKDKVQVMRLRERAINDIQSRSKRVTRAIEEKRHIGLFLRLAHRLGYELPQDSKRLFLSGE